MIVPARNEETSLGPALVAALPADFPVILYAKGTAPHLTDQAFTGARVLSVDWTNDLAVVRRNLPANVAVQGNLDPVTLYASPDAIRGEVGRALDAYRDGNGGSRDGHVFNLGHGMSPDMNPEHVAVLVEAVHSHSRR